MLWFLFVVLFVFVLSFVPNVTGFSVLLVLILVPNVTGVSVLSIRIESCAQCYQCLCIVFVLSLVPNVTGVSVLYSY